MPRILLTILLSVLFLSAYPQKVGLVLSGGGAKGISHIGLIKVLEDNNIPIDYVTGTSIGAIVAGLYAAGYSPEEMVNLFESDEFRLWSTGKMEKDDLYYFKNKDELPDWIKVDVTKKDDKIKVIFPMNFIPERQMDFAFMQLMAQTTAACEGNFDDMMVPFRCVATDIYHSRAITLKSGDLGEAIRASMTVPFVFKPIKRDGNVLFDGGIVNNFPADIMIDEFNPDIIIGHKVSNIGANDDMDDIVGQIESMVTQKTNYSVPDSMGILLESKLDDVGLLDFQKVQYIYDKGVETAIKSLDSIQKMISRRESKEDLARRREYFNIKKPPLVFSNVQIEGVQDELQRKYIIESVKDKNKTISLSSLRDSYFKLITDEHIKSIQPVAYYNKKTGYFDLHMKVELRKPFDLDIGGHLSTSANTFGFLGVNYKTFRRLSLNLSSNLIFGKFYNSFMLGGRVDAPTLTPFFLSTYFTLNSWDYLSTSTDLIFSDIKSSYIIKNESNIRVEAGYPFIKTGIIDFGASYSKADDKYFQKTLIKTGDELDKTSFSAFSTYVRLEKKNFDYKQYPTQGGRKMFLFRYINGTEKFKPGNTSPILGTSEQKQSFFQIKALYDQYFNVYKKLSLGVLFEASFNNRKLLNNYTATVVSSSAFQPTPNSKSMFIGNFHANQYFAGGGKIIYKMSDYFHLRTELYGFLPIQRLEMGDKNSVYFDDKIFQNIHLMGLAALVLTTQIGPLSLELNYYDKPGAKWFASLNMGFMLFNKRGF